MTSYDVQANGRSRKYHPEWGNPDTKEHTWYVFTHKWIFALNFTMPVIQPSDTMDLRRKEDRGIAASILHWGANRMRVGGWGIGDLGGTEEEEEIRGQCQNMVRIWGRYRGSGNRTKNVAGRVRKYGDAYEVHRHQGNMMFPGHKGDDFSWNSQIRGR